VISLALIDVSTATASQQRRAPAGHRDRSCSSPMDDIDGPPGPQGLGLRGSRPRVSIESDNTRWRARDYR